MSKTLTDTHQAAADIRHWGERQGWFAAGGIIGALLASSCCIAPLVLLMLGVSGAWISHLTALAPYKPYFVALTLIFLGLGFWQAYFKPKPVCEEGSYCAGSAASIVIQVALWMATILVLLALTINWWAPLFY